MPDASTTVADLRVRLGRFVRERDWEGYHNPKDLAAALSIEASELLERFLWQDAGPGTAFPEEDRQAIADELADVVIYALHFANAMDLDVSEAVARKMGKNEAKYPVERFKGRARSPSRDGLQ